MLAGRGLGRGNRSRERADLGFMSTYIYQATYDRHTSVEEISGIFFLQDCAGGGFVGHEDFFGRRNRGFQNGSEVRNFQFVEWERLET